MNNTRSQYLPPGEPTLEEIEQAMRRGERMRAQAFREVTRAVAVWCTRILARCAMRPAAAGRIARHAHAG